MKDAQEFPIRRLQEEETVSVEKLGKLEDVREANKRDKMWKLSFPHCQ